MKQILLIIWLFMVSVLLQAQPTNIPVSKTVAVTSDTNGVLLPGTASTNLFSSNSILLLKVLASLGVPTNNNGGNLTNIQGSNIVGMISGAGITNNSTGVTLSGTFTGNGGGLTNLAYTNLVNRLLFANLRDFGAVGNGSTDDSTAIQNWLTYCYTNSMNGYAPAGHYYTTTSNIFTVPAGYPNLFGSWKLIGDGPSQTVFIEGTTNADLFVNVSGIQGTFIEGIGFVGPGDGIHAVGTRLLVFGTNGAANANLIQNCGFYNSWIGCYAWAENTKFDTCTFQDNITGLIWPNNVVGNNNDIVANCQFTEGILAGKLATNATSCTNLVFYAGGGHAVFGSTFTGLKSSDIGIAIPQSGVGINLTADYVEMNGCGEFIKAVPANGIGHINMYSCTGITGGADGNTNHYPVEIGGGMSLTVDYGDSLAFWSSKSLYKQNIFANTFIDFSGYNSAITVDEYSSGSYLYTLLITPSVLYVASSTSTNAIGANGQTMTVNGVNVFGIDSSGNVTGNSFVPTSTSTGPSYGYYSGGSALQISSGANGGYIDGQSSGTFLHWDGSGNFTITNGLTVGQTLTASGTGTFQSGATVNDTLTGSNGTFNALQVSNATPTRLAIYNGAAWLTNLASGTSGQTLVSQGSSSIPVWSNFPAGGGSGTVTSVTFTGDGTVLSSTPSSAVTASGTVAATLAAAAANTVLSGPSSGSASTPTYQTAPTISAANMTSLNASSITSGQVPNANATNYASLTSTSQNWGPGTNIFAGSITASNLATVSQTNDSAAPGFLGETNKSLVASGSAVSLSTTTTANVTTMSLSAGSWDVYGVATWTTAAATVTSASCSISATTTTVASDGSESHPSVVGTLLSGVSTVGMLPLRIKLSANGTVYLCAVGTFSAGTVSVYGGIYANRSR